jgi:hypothetical protein
MEKINKLQNSIKRSLDKHNELELIYPNRHKEIHKVACKHCPTVFNKKYNITDPEHEEVKLLSREVQIKTVFICGWRSSKLCKGYCDEFNINEKDLL